MITAKNQRVYLVLDPDEAAELRLILLRGVCQESIDSVDNLREAKNRNTVRMSLRLERAIERAKAKGAKFTK